jgi:hypothetical protein
VKQVPLPLYGSEPAGRDALERLRAVVEEHDKLLTIAARKRKELERVELDVRAAVMRVMSHVEPLQEEGKRLDEAIHRMLEALSSAKERPRPERTQIRRFHRELQNRFFISENRAKAAAVHAANEAGLAAPDVVAVKESERGTLRDLYRSLAEALHPDKVQDEQDKASRTELMKEVTVAYRERDFARLVEIERTWAASRPLSEGDRGDEVERRSALLLQSNVELRKQIRDLAERLSDLRHSQDGQLAKDLKRRGRRNDVLAEIIGPIEADLKELRHVHAQVQAFHDGKIGLAELLDVPAALVKMAACERGEVDDPEEFREMLHEVLAELEDEDEAAPPKRKRRRRSTGRRRS